MFDRTKIYFGSSNLSLTGMDRNLEFSGEIIDEKYTQIILEELTRNGAFLNKISEQNINEMLDELKIVKRSITDPFEERNIIIDEVVQEGLIEELQDEFTGEVEEDKQKKEEEKFAFENANERLLEIQKCLKEKDVLNYNQIDGNDFASSTKVPIDTDDENQMKQFYVSYKKLIEKDVNSINSILLPRLNIEINEKNKKYLQALFIHANAKTTDGPVEYSLQEITFYKLGFNMLSLEIGLMLTDRKLLSIRDVDNESIISHKALTLIDYDGFLQKYKFHTLLHKSGQAVITDDIPKKQALSIIGAILFYNGQSGYKITRPLLNNLAEEGIACTDGTVGTVQNPGRYLQEFSNYYKLPLSYDVEKTGGTDDKPEFSCIITLGKRRFDPLIGSSKKNANEKAAESALRLIVNDYSWNKMYEDFIQKKYAMKRFYYKKYHLSMERNQECILLADKLGINHFGRVPLIDVALTLPGYKAVDKSSRSHEKLAHIGSILCVLGIEILLINNYGPISRLQMESANRIQKLSGEVLIEFVHKNSIIEIIKSRKETKISDKEKQQIAQAIIATSFFYGGYQAFLRFWNKHFSEALCDTERIKQNIVAKSELQGLCQSRGEPVPTYKYLQNPECPDHAQEFSAECIVNNEVLAIGKGKTHKSASEDAARKAIVVYKKQIESEENKNQEKD
jgi:dsRNA-specific ribonuclease